MAGEVTANPSPQGGGQNQVTVKFGVYTEKMPSGTTVAQARERLNKIASMSADTSAFINGQKVEDNTPLDGNQTVQFMKRTGEKG